MSAAEAEAASFWAHARNRLVVWIVRTYFPNARSLFELGCGIGIVLEALRAALPGARLVGGDGYAPELDVAVRRLPDVELLQLDARNLPFEAEFDVVTALDVLEHVDDDRGVLRQIFRALRPGGGIVLAVPQHQWLWSAADEWALHERRYSRRDLLEKTTASGFEIVRTSSFVTTLLPVMGAARFAQRVRRHRYDPTAEFRLARPLDALLRRALLLDKALIERGLDLPVGGSLFVVGRRPSAS